MKSLKLLMAVLVLWMTSALAEDKSSGKLYIKGYVKPKDDVWLKHKYDLRQRPAQKSVKVPFKETLKVDKNSVSMKAAGR